MSDRPESSSDERSELLPSRLGPLIQLSGMVRKELVEVLRQPRILLVLVLGPFLVLFLFAGGFDPGQNVLTTTFVGPADSVYEENLLAFEDELEEYLEVFEYTTDLVRAREQLIEKDIDLIVVFPSDPAETVLAGERAPIRVIHDKIDPIARTAVEVSTEISVQEMNARILEEVVGRAQEALVAYEDSIAESSTLIGELGEAAAAEDDERVASTLTELDRTTGALETIVDVSGQVATTLDADSEETQALDQLSDSTGRLRDSLTPLVEAPDNISEDDAAQLSALLDEVAAQGETVTTLDPRVVVRPFTSETATLERRSISIISFFATGAIALLLQHMVFTFAAMSFVSDRSLGLFEIFRVGPIGPGRVLVGKYVAFTIIGAVVAAALLAAVHWLLDVPMRGDVGWLAGGLLLLLIASIGFGSTVSLLSGTVTQAVQYSLLALLAGLFFGGFFLDVDSFVYPVRAVIFLFPVTYGTSILREVMLRGNEPEIGDIIGLSVSSVAYLVAAWSLLSLRLRTR